jgi:3-hydroxyacyl-CoA dehydrogenase
MLDLNARAIARTLERIAEEAGIRDWKLADWLIEDFVERTELRFGYHTAW